MSRAFSGWITQHTIPILLEDLSRARVPVSRQAVYKWKRGSSYPSPERIPIILELAEGKLSLGDVVRPRSRPGRYRGRV